ncbi:MAG: MarR family transcriptional regulator [Novosphingobium sp.]
MTLVQAATRFDYGWCEDADRPETDVAWLSPCNPLAVSIFADRAYLRTELAEDAAAAGLRVARTGEVASLLGASGQVPLGDIVLIDCPVLEAAEMAALALLDAQVAKSGAQMVVSTSMGSLDDVFGCLDQSAAQILVSPARAERVIALGHILLMPEMAARAGRVRELSDHDRMSLLRLTQQVGAIAQRLEALSGTAADTGRVEASAFAFDATGERDPATKRLIRGARPSLPDPRLVRRIIRQRQLRARFFEGDLFADPAWDMLLDLTAARSEHKRVSVTSLCIASGVPPTTALRWISQMTDAGLLCRAEDATDRRRAFIALSDKAADNMAHYFAEIEAAALPV